MKLFFTIVLTGPVLQYTIAMMGYGPEDKSAVLELTYNYGVTEYDKGNAYAQVSFALVSLLCACTCFKITCL